MYVTSCEGHWMWKMALILFYLLKSQIQILFQSVLTLSTLSNAGVFFKTAPFRISANNSDRFFNPESQELFPNDGKGGGGGGGNGISAIFQ